ncbi:alpha/beta-hydrolase [Ophiobolus disseminans]|uniref:Alpha/beta-hydrolase n=1 Tax=Ophiobolus disseminans TaxID=1469910 RepID=A0A6A6ZNT7_9PLEO|nr:alpha/beta-hydrolase [Ophiobolus disseminans]
MRYAVSSLALLSLLPSALAAPGPVAAPVAVPEPTPAPSLENAAVTLDERQLLGGLLSGLNGAIIGLLGNVNSAVAAKNPGAINSALVKVTAANRPTNIADAVARASKVWANPTGRTDIYAAIATQVAVGLGPLLDGTLTTAFTGGLPVSENGINNNNPRPSTTIYPRKESSDAPYSLSEEALRRAIFIPPSFTYGSGSKRPVIMVPGTGAYGGANFANNLRKLLQGQPFADPVWLNIPGAMLGDAQVNAEYIAYAINYISARSNNNQNLAVIAWSQGGLDTQWVFKYWPSTRKVVKDFFPVSSDFRGTVLANALCLSPNSNLGLNLCPPSVIQQQATSDYVRRLRSGGGDSAYVPTTTFYSGFFDEIVQPQSGTGASGFLNAGNGVAVSNNEVQRVCAGRLGAGFYGHAGVLFHPLTFALIVDALKNDGPGSISRIDVASVCNNLAAPGLDLDDVIATSGLIPIAGVLLLAYPDKRLTEPGLKAYAV